MSLENFFIYVDKEGKMPILRQIGSPLVMLNSHKYWIEYRNNTPVACNPYPGQTEVWDYRQVKYVPITSLKREG